MPSQIHFLNWFAICFLPVSVYPATKVLTDDRKKGLSMIITALNKTLNEIGLEVVNPINSQFDPLSSEVLMEKEDDKNPDNVVLEVIRKGYKINGVLIKPAQVIVSKHKN